MRPRKNDPNDTVAEGNQIHLIDQGFEQGPIFDSHANLHCRPRPSPVSVWTNQEIGPVIWQDDNRNDQTDDPFAQSPLTEEEEELGGGGGAQAAAHPPLGIETTESGFGSHESRTPVHRGGALWDKTRSF